MQQTYIATAEETHRLEAAAVAAGATWPGLMERAGRGIADLIVERVGNVGGKHVLVLVGPGNNGGDGLVIARHLHDQGALVALYLWHRPERADDHPWQACRERTISEISADGDHDQSMLRQTAQQADIIVDALLGIGVTRPIDGTLRAIGETINEVRSFRSATPPWIVAVDLPTGIHADTGAIMSAAIQADLTVATGVLKYGHVRDPGQHTCGEVVCVSLGLPSLED